jgi:N-acetylmuramoyl-L-alanine amidase
MNNKAKLMTIAIALALILSASPGMTASANTSRGATLHEEEYHNGIKNVKEKSLYYVRNKNVWSYERFDALVQGEKLSISGLRINNVDYIPFRAAASALGIGYTYDSKNKTSIMHGQGIVLSATEGCFSVYANDRPLFASSPVVIMSDGRMYIPAASFAKATGLTVSKSGKNVSLSGSFKALAPASKFYDNDAVLWLARIIHAESSGEPLLGKIAVGNVVLNRVKHPSYPNTIYGVIFDRKYGVQFSPVLYGTIYNTPSYESTLAAKICLEGFDISEGALFFLHPEISSSSWIPSSRQYKFSIGNHDFYV